MSRAIGRIQAEQDLRAIAVTANSQSGEGTKSLSDHLVIEMGEVTTRDSSPLDAERDEGGFAQLKAMC